MSDIFTNFTDYVEQIGEDSDLLHLFINGTAQQTVPTANGNIPTLAAIAANAGGGGGVASLGSVVKVVMAADGDGYAALDPTETDVFMVVLDSGSNFIHPYNNPGDALSYSLVVNVARSGPSGYVQWHEDVVWLDGDSPEMDENGGYIIVTMTRLPNPAAEGMLWFARYSGTASAGGGVVGPGGPVMS